MGVTWRRRPAGSRHHYLNLCVKSKRYIYVADVSEIAVADGAISHRDHWVCLEAGRGGLVEVGSDRLMHPRIADAAARLRLYLADTASLPRFLISASSSCRHFVQTPAIAHRVLQPSLAPPPPPSRPPAFVSRALSHSPFTPVLRPTIHLLLLSLLLFFLPGSLGRFTKMGIDGAT